MYKGERERGWTSRIRLHHLNVCLMKGRKEKGERGGERGRERGERGGGERERERDLQSFQEGVLSAHKATPSAKVRSIRFK